MPFFDQQAESFHELGHSAERIGQSVKIKGNLQFPGITAIRTGRYKYVEYQKDVWPKELFDLKSDPNEMENIIGTPAGRRLAEELRKEMHQLRKETGYQLRNRG